MRKKHRQKQDRNAHQRGISLIELIIAVGVSGIVVVGATQAFKLFSRTVQSQTQMIASNSFEVNLTNRIEHLFRTRRIINPSSRIPEDLGIHVRPEESIIFFDSSPNGAPRLTRNVVSSLLGTPGTASLRSTCRQIPPMNTSTTLADQMKALGADPQKVATKLADAIGNLHGNCRFKDFSCAGQSNTGQQVIAVNDPRRPQVIYFPSAWSIDQPLGAGICGWVDNNNSTLNIALGFAVLNSANGKSATGEAFSIQLRQIALPMKDAREFSDVQWSMPTQPESGH